MIEQSKNIKQSVDSQFEWGDLSSPLPPDIDDQINELACERKKVPDFIVRYAAQESLYLAGLGPEPDPELAKQVDEYNRQQGLELPALDTLSCPKSGK